MTWSDEVPTEPGQYFAMYPGCDKSEPLILTPAGAFFVVGNDSPVDMEIAPYCGTRFCRIPTPEELEAMRNRITDVTQQRDSAESELERVREQLAEIHQSWGMRNEH